MYVVRRVDIVGTCASTKVGVPTILLWVLSFFFALVLPLLIYILWLVGILYYYYYENDLTDNPEPPT